MKRVDGPQIGRASSLASHPYSGTAYAERSLALRAVSDVAVTQCTCLRQCLQAADGQTIIMLGPLATHARSSTEGASTFKSAIERLEAVKRRLSHSDGNLCG